ncbi:penicillin-binding protein 1C [Candidatus Hydrogenosomobacter endosymbioticus]|uniref:peptidoglycan glycosyltransferase n=2 Tax=Candidatus Hydrogenosomobacter endosymbioticus TaxID=2558174 RepID=A0ABM7V8J6_9PROT|nr:penicillin-binding protein 1C [Candidatus Hydrogenosomobacter endosymbioticus]
MAAIALSFALSFPPDLTKINDISYVLLDKDGNILAATMSKDDKWRIFTKSKNTSPIYIKMLKTFEDKRFDRHNGVDILAIVRSATHIITKKKFLSGASTITMQVAKMLSQKKKNKIYQKIIQCIRAIQLEIMFPKETILDMYLTLAPFGYNIEGLFAASWIYFGKAPSELNTSEAAFLVAIPKSPSCVSNKKKLIALQKKTLRRLVDKGAITKEDAKLTEKIALSFCKKKPEMHAQNLLYRLINKADQSKSRYLLNLSCNQLHKSFMFETTIDRFIQIECEKILLSEVYERLSSIDPILNAAAVIMDAKSGCIVSYVGSAAFGDKLKSGYVDMADALRSPGSTLKPFIYAIGMEMGFLGPATTVYDGKTNFGNSYSPKNLQRDFMGDVTVEDALLLSLNSPAVAALETIGPEKFMQKIREAGAIAKTAKNSPPSLPIALGGLGISLTDLVSLYSAFPRDGTCSRPIFFKNKTPQVTKFLTKNSARQIHEILSMSSNKSASDLMTTPYKTGTSYGGRDALTIGYTENYVIGVLVGRADGKSIPSVSGESAALPIFTRLASETIGDSAKIVYRKSHYTILSQRLSTKLPKKQRLFLSRMQKMALDNQIYISFPENSSTLCVHRGENICVVTQKGTAPLSWFIDGHPRISEKMHESTLIWIPEDEGWHKITAVDTDGKYSSILVEILFIK